ncbi:glycosyltransferase [Paenibacillus sp. ISL-20]|uniref:glycosyltransferase n=1 Tax=Paenibacillus sp. ISL-20 TaxID=2819163 RepID=UPI001BE6D162|nr:glycosyltransferase [Paenibacillus sp. ISL-20]MBT2762071.1 glycosyltransferase [Paenibacillus sp. ISL-20]
MTRTSISPSQPTVSIITCTKRAECLHNLLENYVRQNYRHKELIVIINHSSLKLSEYQMAAKPYRNVRIYSKPEDLSLGSCLNFGVKVSKHSIIAKFDDDDYYAPDYLKDSVHLMIKTRADIVGKRAHFMQLAGQKDLLYRYPNMANQWVPLVQGATLLVRRNVFNQVAFPNQNRSECVKFCADCITRNFRIYSGSPYHFIANRRRNSKNHTWMVSDKNLLTQHVKRLQVDNAKKFASRS